MSAVVKPTDESPTPEAKGRKHSVVWDGADWDNLQRAAKAKTLLENRQRSDHLRVAFKPYQIIIAGARQYCQDVRAEAIAAGIDFDALGVEDEE